MTTTTLVLFAVLVANVPFQAGKAPLSEGPQKVGEHQEIAKIRKQSEAQTPSVTTREITLGSGDRMFNSVVLTNTHSRVFTDASRPPAPPPAPSVSNQCSLDQKTPGVIWKVVLRGASVPAREIAVSDEAGREFVPTCWSSSGGVYQLDARGNRTGGGPQTEFLAAGPDSTKQLTFKFGGTSAVVVLGK